MYGSSFINDDWIGNKILSNLLEACNVSIFKSSTGAEVEVLYVKRAPLNLNEDVINFTFNKDRLIDLNATGTAWILKGTVKLTEPNDSFDRLMDIGSTVNASTYIRPSYSANKFQTFINNDAGTPFFNQVTSNFATGPKGIYQLERKADNTMCVTWDGVVGAAIDVSAGGSLTLDKGELASEGGTFRAIECLFYDFSFDFTGDVSFISNDSDGKVFSSDTGTVFSLTDASPFDSQYPNYTPSDPNDIVSEIATGNLSFNGTTYVEAVTPHNVIDYNVDGVMEHLLLTRESRADVVPVLTLSHTTLLGNILVEQRDNLYMGVVIIDDTGVNQGFVIFLPSTSSFVISVKSVEVSASLIDFEVYVDGVYINKIANCDRTNGYTFNKSELATSTAGAFGGAVRRNLTADENGVIVKDFNYMDRLRADGVTPYTYIDSVSGSANVVNSTLGVFPYYDSEGAFLVEDRQLIDGACVTIPAGQEVVTHLTIPVTNNGVVVTHDI